MLHACMVARAEALGCAAVQEACNKACAEDWPHSATTKDRCLALPETVPGYTRHPCQQHSHWLGSDFQEPAMRKQRRAPNVLLCQLLFFHRPAPLLRHVRLPLQTCLQGRGENLEPSGHSPLPMQARAQRMSCRGAEVSSQSSQRTLPSACRSAQPARLKRTGHAKSQRSWKLSLVSHTPFLHRQLSSHVHCSEILHCSMTKAYGRAINDIHPERQVSLNCRHLVRRACGHGHSGAVERCQGHWPHRWSPY